MRDEVKEVVLHAVLNNPRGASLKRLAWGYACARKGSDEEKRLLAVLVERIQGGLS